MQYNILRESEVTKIFLTYADGGMKKKFAVKLRFMDLKECYFAVPLPANFRKPKIKTPVEINAFTPDGVYTAHVNIVDSSVSLTEVLFHVSVPKTWDFKQLRQSTRVQQALPLNIKYDDGFEISSNTFDFSIGGFSFVSEKNISSIYERLDCTVTVEMPSTLIVNFPDKKLITKAKYVRKKENFGEYGSDGTLYAFRFIKLSADEQEILKAYLLNLS